MDNTIHQIGFFRLAWAFVPVAAVLAVLARWGIGVKPTLIALARMVVQLIAIGYALTFIFAGRAPWLTCAILAVMLSAAGHIALRPVRGRKDVYPAAMAGIGTGGLLTLCIVAGPVLGIDPWYAPRYIIPLAGMIFATSMNAVSLGAERFHAEIERGTPASTARTTSMKAALIPITNSLFAVGLVSLPGMMTGQILSGVSPLIAVRYQIMVMCMVYGSSGIAAAIFLALVEKKATGTRRVPITAPPRASTPEGRSGARPCPRSSRP